MTERSVENFGRNLSWTAVNFFQPRSEDEVLAILDRCRGRHIRVVGRLHSWSPAMVGEDVLLDLQFLDRVHVERRGDRVWAQIGAGCQIKRALEELEIQANVTLPSLGLITEQTYVGAAATATHGSGTHSLSHTIVEIRVAVFDEAGRAIIRTISEGPELRAAPCSRGCVGGVLSGGIWCRDQYHVEEHWRRHRSLDDVIAAAERFPLQQFFLIPWLWEFIAQHRREVSGPRSRLAGLYRWYVYLVFDITFHLVILSLLQCGRRALVHGFFRRVLSLTVVKRWRVVDKSQKMLVMEHQLFRHVEIELFVTQSRIHEALAFTEEVLKYFAGDEGAISSETKNRLSSSLLWEQLSASRGRYLHHYPICVRRILPDHCMLSMASGTDEPWYAISFISYDPPERLDNFLTFAQFLTKSMVALFAARPHWGKICPLNADDVEHLYPELANFRDVCTSLDPEGAFRNDWLNGLLFSKYVRCAKSSRTPE